MKKKEDFVKTSFPYIILGLVIIVAFLFYNNTRFEVHELTTGELMSAIKDSKVSEITITPKSSESVYYITGKLTDYKEGESFTSKVVEEEVSSIVE